MRRLVPLLALAAACQEPFAVNRKDLGPFRIAAAGVVDGEASAAIWSGEGAYHDQAPELTWTLDGQDLGSGWGIPVTGEGSLGLVVTAPDGSLHEAQVSVGTPVAPFSVRREALDLGEDLSLEARRALVGEEVETAAASGRAMRLQLTWPTEDALPEGGGPDLRTHWMTAEGQGTLLELDTFRADVLAEELTWEDGEIVARTPGEEGVSTHLALVLDGLGGNRWTWIDTAIGDELVLVRHEGRLLPLDLASSGLVAVTLQEGEDLWGLRYEDPEPVTDLSAQDALACAPAGQAFRLAWVVEGRCTRPELLGARVVLELW